MPWMNLPFLPTPLEQVVDLRAAAVDDHRIHADQLEQHHVAREAFLQLRIGHGVAAVLDDDGLVEEALDVGQRLGEDPGLGGGGNGVGVRSVMVGLSGSIAGAHSTRRGGNEKRGPQPPSLGIRSPWTIRWSAASIARPPSWAASVQARHP